MMPYKVTMKPYYYYYISNFLTTKTTCYHSISCITILAGIYNIYPYISYYIINYIIWFVQRKKWYKEAKLYTMRPLYRLITYSTCCTAGKFGGENVLWIYSFQAFGGKMFSEWIGYSQRVMYWNYYFGWL